MKKTITEGALATRSSRQTQRAHSPIEALAYPATSPSVGSQSAPCMRPLQEIEAGRAMRQLRAALESAYIGEPLPFT